MVSVVVWDGSSRNWLLYENQKSHPISSSLGAISAYIHGTAASPFETAYKVARQLISAPLPEADPSNIDPTISQSGRVPPGYSNWTFLGAFRNHPDYGGGDTFAYLLQIDNKSFVSNVARKVAMSELSDLLSSDTLTVPLAEAATFSLAMLHINGSSK